MNIKNISIGILLGLYGGGAALANPTGASVVSGSASISASGNLLQVTNSPNAIINWQSFSIANGETTQFIQQGAQSAVLNRVVGNNLSEIHGSLTSNGRVFLINQAGIVFGENALVDTAGLLASSLDISNEDFLAGNMHFEGDNAGSVINRGVITAGPGGEIVLIAPQIENSGVITVQDGALILAAGESVTLSSWDLDGVEFEVQAPENEVLNLGKLVADKGAVGLFAGSIRHEGTIEANSLSLDASGNVVLSAMQNIELSDSSSISASGASAGDVLVISEQGDVYASGSLSASSTEGAGGSVKVLGERVELLGGASVDVSGANGGGEALIGGGYQGANDGVKNSQMTVITETASIHADALENGDGGKVIVWSDGVTRSHGEITAKGGAESGDGGFVETSGKQFLDVTQAADTSAENGQGGTWLLDPANIEIVASVGNINTVESGSPANVFEYRPDQNSSQISVGVITAGLLNGGAGGEVILDTSDAALAGVLAGEQGDINVNEDISFSTSILGSATLTLKAHNDINVNSIISSSLGVLNVNLISDQDDAAGGNINVNAAISSNGGAVQFIGDVVNVNSGGVVTTHGVTSTGNIAVEANDLFIDVGAGAVLDTSQGANNGNILIRTRFNNQTQNISLGYATAVAGTLSIEANEFTSGLNTGDNKGNVVIGSGSHQGDITVGGQVVSFGINDFEAYTLGDFVFDQNGPGINLAGKNVSINAGSIVTSLAAGANADITAANVTLNTASGIDAGAIKALEVVASTVQFNNVGSGRVGLSFSGSPTTVTSGNNNNGSIVILQKGSSNTLTLNDISAGGTGDINIASNIASVGADIIIDSIGITHTGSGDIKVRSLASDTDLTMNGVIQHSGSGNIELVADGANAQLQVNGSGVTHSGTGDIQLSANNATAKIQISSAPVSTNNGKISLLGGKLTGVAGSSLNAKLGGVSGSGDVYLTTVDGGSLIVNQIQDSTDTFALTTLQGINAANVHFGSDVGGTKTQAISWGGGLGATVLPYNMFFETKSTGSISVESAIGVGTNNLTFTTDDFSTTAALSGTGDLVFNAAGSTRNIGLGDSTPVDGGMEITNSDIAQFQNGFNHIAFSTQSGRIEVTTDTTGFNDSIILNSGNNIDVNAALATSDAGDSIAMTAANGIDLGGTVRTQGGVIAFNSPVTVSAGTYTVQTNAGVPTGADITFTGNVNGPGGLSLIAGTAGDIDLSTNTVNGLASLSASGQNIKLGAVTTTGAQTYSAGTSTELNGNLQTDGGAVTFNGDTAVNVANVIVDTKQTPAASGNGGNVDFTGKVSAFTGLANASLTIDTTGGSLSTGGNVSLAGVDNTSGAFLETVKVIMGGSGGGTGGVLTLNNNVQLAHQGGAAATTGFIVTGTGTKVALSQSTNILTGNGQIEMSAADVYASAATPVDLTLNAGSGNVFLNAFGDNATNNQYVNDVSVTSSGDISLAGDINLDNNMTDTASFTVNGGGDVLIAKGSALAIKTEQDNSGNAGDIDFSAVTIKESVANSQLTLDASHASSGNAGTVKLAQVGDTAQYLSGLQVRTNSVGGVNGRTELNGAIQTDVGGIIQFDGDVLLKGNTTVVSGQAVSSTITFAGDISGDSPGAQTLSVNSGSGSTFVNSIGQMGGNTLGNTSFVVGPAGNAEFTGDIDLDGDLTVSGGGNAVIHGPRTIRTDVTSGGVAGNVSFTGVTLGGENASGSALTIDTQSTGATGGTISLGAVGQGPSGEYLANLIIDANGATNKGAVNLSQDIDVAGQVLIDGNVTLNGDVAISSTASSANGALGFAGTIDGGNTLALTSGTGIISLGGNVGVGTALTSLALNSGSTVQISAANLITNNDLVLSQNISLTSPSTKITSNNGTVNLSGNIVGTALDVNAATGIALTGANAINSFSANNATSGAVDFNNTSALQIAGAGVHNNGAGSTDHIDITTAGALQVDASIVAVGGNITFNSNNNDITVAASGTTTDIKTQGSTSNVTLNAGTGNILAQGGSTANSDVRISAGNSVGGSLSIIAGNLTAQAGSAAGSVVRMDAHTTDIDLTGDLSILAGTAVDNLEATIAAAALLDVDLTGPGAGNINITAGSNGSNALLIVDGASGGQIDVNTIGDITLTGGTGANALAAIANTTGDVDINIGEGTAIGGNVVLNGGSGSGAAAMIGHASFDGTVENADITVRTNGDIRTGSSTALAQIGAFDKSGGSASSGAGQITLEAGLGATGGNVGLGDATVKSGTTGRVTLAAHDVSPGLHTVGQIKQGAAGAIIADQLYVTTFNAIGNTPITLNGSGNNVNKLAMRVMDIAGTTAVAGNAQYRDIDNVEISAAGLGLTTGQSAIEGSTTAIVRVESTAGQITQGALMTDAINAGFVDMAAATGITLNNVDNDVTFFSASNSASGNIALFEKGGFTVGANALLDGISNVGRDVKLISTGNIGQATSSDDQILAGLLHVETRNVAGQIINLTHISNDVDNLILRTVDVSGNALPATGGSIDYLDVDGFSINGTGLGGAQQALESNGNITLTAGGDITQGASASDAINTNSGLTVKTLNNTGSAVTLNNTANTINGSLSAVSRNAADTANASGTINVNTTTAIVLGDLQTTGNAQIAMTGGNLTQSGGAVLEVGGTLIASADGGVNLTESTNAINTIAVSNTGASGNIHVNNSQAWTVTATNTAASGGITLLNFGGDTTLNALTAATGTVSLTTAGSVIDGNGAASNIIANQIAVINAGTGIGSVAAGIELEAATIANVDSASGDIVLVHNAAGTVATFGQVIVDGSGTGDIHISSAAADADIAVSGILSTGAMSSPGEGDITVITTGVGSDISINGGGAVGTTGNLVINSAANFNQDGLFAFGGLNRNATVTAAGNIVMGVAGTTTNTTGGTTTYTAGGNLAVNTIDVGTNALSLTATAGAVSDVNGALVNITAGTVDFVSATGIDLDFSKAGALSINQALATSGGNINLDNIDAAGGFSILGNIGAGTGQVQLTANADVLQSGGTLTAADLIINAAGTVAVATAVIDTADISTSGAITLADTGTLQVNQMNSTAAGDINVTTTGQLNVAGTGISNTSGNISLTGQGIDINSNTNAATGSLTLNAQTTALNVNGATATASGTVTATASDLSVLGGTTKAEIKANGNVIINLTGNAVLQAGATGDAILESTAGDVNLLAVNVGLTAGATQDALIKAANGNAVLSHSGTCTNCNPTTITAGADAGVIANNVLSIISAPGTANWTGFGDGVTWSDAANWFGNTVALSGDINLDANVSASPFEINVDSVIAANSLLGTKNLNIVTGGDLTIATAFNYASSDIRLTGGDFSLSAGGTVNSISLSSASSSLNIAGTLDVANGYSQSAGITHLDSGTLKAATAMTGGSLTGNGTIDGNLLMTNSTLSPGNSAGLISITGNLDLGAGSVLDIQLGGTDAVDYDRVAVAGNITIDNGAELDVSLINGFAPVVGNTFAPLSYASKTGSFGTQSLPANFSATLGVSALELLVSMAAVEEADEVLDILGDEVVELLGEIDDLENTDEDEDDDEDADLADGEDSESEFSGTLVCS